VSCIKCIGKAQPTNENFQNHLTVSPIFPFKCSICAQRNNSPVRLEPFFSAQNIFIGKLNKMLTKAALSNVSQFLKYQKYFGCLPISWDYKKEEFCEHHSSNWIGRVFYCFVILPYYTFITIQIYVHRSSTNKSGLAILFPMWCFCMLINILFLRLAWNHMDLIRTANRALSQIKRFHKTFMPSFDPNRYLAYKIRDTLSSFLILSVFISTFLYTIYFYRHPNLPISPWNWKRLNKLYNRTTNVLGAALFWYGANHVAGILIFHIVIGFMYLPALYQIVRLELRVPKTSQQNTISKLRNWQIYTKEYRAWEVLHIHVMEFYSPFLILFNATAVQISLFCNVMLFKKWDKLGPVSKSILIFWTGIVQITWIIALEMGGEIFKQGTKTIVLWNGYDWGSVFGNKMKKFAKSCRPIRVNHRSVYTIRKRNVLTFLKAILRGTFRAFLALKSKNG